MAERLAYNENVSGSNPLLSILEEIAQLVRVVVCHAIGRGFESRFSRLLNYVNLYNMSSLFYSESTKILVLIIFALLLTFLIVFLSYILSVSNPDTEKVSAYECGFDPYEDARNTFDVRFYLVSILFIIFDLETIYLFPWCSAFSFLNAEAYWGMLDFVVELLAGYIYAWEAGALEWE